MTQAIGNSVKNEDAKKTNVWHPHIALEGLYKGY